MKWTILYYSMLIRASALQCSSRRIQQFALFSQKTLVQGNTYETELVEKKSRFIGYAQHAETWEKAKNYLEEVKALHPKARHWCFAYVGEDTERSSDDGEPTSTAGAPILSALQAENFANVICIVVRYFGGIKLGKGGLIRAYGGTARQILREAETIEQIPTRTVRITVEASHIGSLYDISSRLQVVTSDEVYGVDGSLTALATCEACQLDSFQEKLKDATRGAVIFDGT